MFLQEISCVKFNPSIFSLAIIASILFPQEQYMVTYVLYSSLSPAIFHISELVAIVLGFPILLLLFVYVEEVVCLLLPRLANEAT